MLVEKDRGNFWMLNWLDQYMVGHKGFIAGGCFKNIFCKEKVKDIDIFFESLADYEDAVNYFDSMTPGYEGDDKRDEEYIFHYQNDKVKAYKNAKTGIRVELCKAVFGTAKEVISRFDFTIVKFAYYKAEVEDETGAEFDPFDFDGMEELAEYHMEKKPETHIEYKIVCDENFFEHLHLKRLVTDDKIPLPMSTFERMIRYIGYGYRPCRETKVKIATAIHDLPEQEIVTGESLYDGMEKEVCCMAKTVKITTDNRISVVEVLWNVEAQGDMIGADCAETVKTQRMYDLFKDYVVMIVDESGLIKNRPDNPAASYLYGADIHGCTIAGDVLFGIQRGPEILPPDDAEAMKSFLMQQFPRLLEAEGV